MASVNKLKDRARDFERKEEWQKAIDAYLQVIRAGEEGDGEPELSLYNRVGDLFLRLGKPADAVDYYQKAADKYGEAGLYNNAIALCNKALRYQPDRLELYLKLGKLSAEQGFTTDARRWYLEYAERLMKSGRTDLAFEALEEFAALSDDAEVREMLAEHLRSHGESDRAVTQMRMAYGLRLRAGESRDAERLRERVLELAPDLDPDEIALEPSDGAAAEEEEPEAEPLPGLYEAPDEIGVDEGYGFGESTAGADATAAEAEPVEDLGLMPTDLATDLEPEVPVDQALEEQVIDQPDEEEIVEPLPTLDDAEYSQLEVEPAPLPGLEGFDDTAVEEQAREVEEIEPLPGFEPATEVEEEEAEPLPMLESGFGDEGAGYEPEEPTIELPGFEPAAEEPETEVPEEFQAFQPAEEEPEPTTGGAWAETELEAEEAREADATAAPAAEPMPMAEPPEEAAPPVAPEWADSSMDEPALEVPEAQEEPVAPEAAEVQPDAEPERVTAEAEAEPEPAAPEAAEAAEAAEEAEEAEAEAEAEASEAVAEEPQGGPGGAGFADAVEEALAGEVFTAAGYEEAEEEEPDLEPAAPGAAAASRDVDARIEAGVARYHAGEREAAVQQLETLHSELADAGALHEALRTAEVVVGLDPESLRAHQHRVEYAFRLEDRERLVDAYLDFAASLGRAGQMSKAGSVYQRVLEIQPDNAIARAAVAGPAPVEPARAPEPAPADDFVDLGDLLMEDEPEETTRFVVAETHESGDEQKDFAEMLSQFRAKVAEHVSEEDSDAHYDLGLAFKEMGLVDEAISEFQIALRGGNERLKVYEELGTCFMLKDQYNIAAQLLSRAAQMPARDDAELLGVYYQLGRCYEQLGQKDAARDAYERVLGLDIDFRDVNDRLRAL